MYGHGRDTVVIDGEMSLLLEGTADCNLLVPESGEAGVFTALHEGYPVYQGPYEVTPTEATQTFNTTFKSTTQNFVVNPIPTNYGRISWNGSVLTVS